MSPTQMNLTRQTVIRIFSIAVLVVITSACGGIIRKVQNGVAEQLTQSALNHDDPETVGAALPAYLLLLDDHTAMRHLRWIVACGFGLVHGFGFAGALTELALPTNRLATALLGFNLGVELGQLGLMVVVWPLLKRLSQLHEQRTRILIIQAGSAAILSAGIFWFVTRAVG